MGNTVLLKNASIIDGSGSAAYLGHIQIKDDKILSVSKQDITAENDSAESIDLEGKFIMPGLIDAHCHISFDEPNQMTNFSFIEEKGWQQLLLEQMHLKFSNQE